MRSAFDRRVVPEEALGLVRACQRRAPARLAGGAALSGAYLAHRLSGDLDLFCLEAGDVRALVRELPEIAGEAGIALEIVRDAGTFVRSRAHLPDRDLEIDFVYEPIADLEVAPALIDGIVVASLTDLRAAKLACILSRSEPRDLVDLMFLDRAGFPPENDLALALRKDAGIDPGVLAWLLGQFPVNPLPKMLSPLTEAELLAFRNSLGERFRRLAVPEAPP